MYTDWASYLCTVDEKPASMFLNLGLSVEESLRKELPNMGFISLSLLDPDENGLSVRAEYDTLCAVEDALRAALEREEAGEDGKTIYAGRCTTDGARDFIYYMADPIRWNEKVAAVLAAFPDYVWEAGTQLEKEWDTYFDLLYPDAEGLNEICNNQVRMQLDEHGDDGSIPRVIDHWLYFPREEDREAFVREAGEEGFVVAEAENDAEENAEAGDEADVSPPDEDNPFGVLLQREDAPDDINEVTWGLRELAGAHGGYYDGWGTTVMNGEEE